GDVTRHQVWGELNAVEIQVDGLGDRPDHQRLGQARHANHQAVPTAEDGGEQVVDDVLLADDYLADLGLELLASLAQPRDRLEVVLGCSGRGRAGHQRICFPQGVTPEGLTAETQSRQNRFGLLCASVSLWLICFNSASRTPPCSPPVSDTCPCRTRCRTGR